MGDLSWWSETSWVQGTACYHEPKVHDHELYFQLININSYVLLPLAILGLFFNASALICLYSPLKSLPACLFISRLCSFSTTCISFHHSKEHTFYKLCMFERRFLKYTLPRLESTINILHVWTIASLSAHRYWKISRPVVSRFKDTASRARYVLVLMFLALLLYRVPIFVLELQIKWTPIFRINRRPQTTELLSPYRIAYHSFFDPIMSNFLPFIWMCIFILTAGVVAPEGQAILASHLKHSDEEAMESDKNRSSELQFHNFNYWTLLVQKKCPTRTDYIQSHVSNVLSMLSASVNAFVFIAFTNRLRLYVQMLIRKTSRSLHPLTQMIRP
uniref:G-protein coupled receptors family 1 profile domain-containing protein n=1 Tax=Ditylenchus dipsaci TaxID=166011 RepID=A0A915DQN0_9BILA